MVYKLLEESSFKSCMRMVGIKNIIEPYNSIVKPSLLKNDYWN